MKIKETNEKQNQVKVDFWAEVYREICLDNESATAVLCSWANFCHALDDCVDQDKDVSNDSLMGVFLSWTVDVALNPFYKEHSQSIHSLLIASANAYLDSEEWALSEDPRKKNFSNAWRSFFSQMVFYVAYEVGGFDHMRAMSRKYRDLIFQVQNEEIKSEGIQPDKYSGTLPDGIQPQGNKRPLKPPFQARSEEEWGRLTTFAASFHHEIDRRFAHVIISDEDDKWIGYAKMVSVPPPGASGFPVFCTAWHPGTPPRQIIEGIKHFTYWGKMQCGGMGTIIPSDSPFIPHMEALGYESWNLTFYATRS